MRLITQSITCDECEKESTSLIRISDLFGGNVLFICYGCLIKATKIIQDAKYEEEKRSFSR